MQVISGKYRSRQLKVPKSARPTTSRARVAVFNMLESLGGMADLEVVDLFAGSGSLGIEALSRGASYATFVDQNAQAVEIVRGNLASIGIQEARVTKTQVETFITAMAPVDFVFIDPPFAYTDEQWTFLLAHAKGRAMFCESNRDITPLIGREWLIVRARVYGDSFIYLLERAEGAAFAENR
jgi:16S rRNA (guanine966-N2)-methyltransferase